MNIFEDNKNNPITPIEFVGDKWKDKPISSLKNDINSETAFAITKDTAGGKYLRGNMLFYSLNGVEVYTDINNIIFVDTINNTLFVREYEKVSKEIAPDNPEQKLYVILYIDLGYENSTNENFPLRWEGIQGRMNVYESIKINAPVIDIDKSLVLVDNVALKDALTVREFVNYLVNADIIDGQDFDINEFSGSEYI